MLRKLRRVCQEVSGKLCWQFHMKLNPVWDSQWVYMLVVNIVLQQRGKSFSDNSSHMRLISLTWILEDCWASQFCRCISDYVWSCFIPQIGECWGKNPLCISPWKVPPCPSTTNDCAKIGIAFSSASHSVGPDCKRRAGRSNGSINIFRLNLCVAVHQKSVKASPYICCQQTVSHSWELCTPQWRHHVSSHLNPADEVSRGLTVYEMGQVLFLMGKIETTSGLLHLLFLVRTGCVNISKEQSTLPLFWANLA